MTRIGLAIASVLSGAALAVSGSPAQALERLEIRMPFLETSILINVGKVQSVKELIQSSPDLIDLQLESNEKILELIKKFFVTPLPLQTRSFLGAAVEQPLLEQALAAAIYFVNIQGVEIDTTGRVLTDALTRAEAKGQYNILGFVQELPGQEASIDFSRVAYAANRLRENLAEGKSLLAAAPPATVSSDLRSSLKGRWTRQVMYLPVSHRSKSIRLVNLIPANTNGRVVVISHGLWDSPESFEGWGEMLAEYGYTVFLPEHSGSDYRQQQLMLAGDRPPPGPEELRLRPLDVSALLDAIRDRRLLADHSLDITSVGVVGHSWGATTTLQLAGAVPTDRKLVSRCNDFKDPERNISWILQCSWLSGIKKVGLVDPRVKAVVAVSPPLRLLFDPESTEKLNSKVLLVSGTRDWVVTSRPEAIRPMRDSRAVEMGHRLVLVDGADHFSLRSVRGESEPALLGPLLLSWMNEQLQVPDSALFSDRAWGHEKVPIVDVSYFL